MLSMWGNMAKDYVSTATDAITQAVFRASALIAQKASEDYAPKGPTLQLARGIRALKPAVRGNEVIGIVISQAKSRSGYNYALKQHNEALRHVSRFPLQSWYGEGQKGKTNRAKYARGYYRLKDTSPKFKTEYLTNAFNDQKDVALRIIRNAVEAT